MEDYSQVPAWWVTSITQQVTQQSLRSGSGSTHLSAHFTEAYAEAQGGPPLGGGRGRSELSLACGQSLLSVSQHTQLAFKAGPGHFTSFVPETVLDTCAAMLSIVRVRRGASGNIHLINHGYTYIFKQGPLFTGACALLTQVPTKLWWRQQQKQALPTPLSPQLPGQAHTTGASGGAIRRPWDRMPAKLVVLDPCHSNLRLCSCLNGL